MSASNNIFEAMTIMGLIVDNDVDPLACAKGIITEFVKRQIKSTTANVISEILLSPSNYNSFIVEAVRKYLPASPLNTSSIRNPVATTSAAVASVVKSPAPTKTKKRPANNSMSPYALTSSVATLISIEAKSSVTATPAPAKLAVTAVKKSDPVFTATPAATNSMTLGLRAVVTENKLQSPSSSPSPKPSPNPKSPNKSKILWGELSEQIELEEKELELKKSSPISSPVPTTAKDNCWNKLLPAAQVSAPTPNLQDFKAVVSKNRGNPVNSSNKVYFLDTEKKDHVFTHGPLEDDNTKISTVLSSTTCNFIECHNSTPHATNSKLCMLYHLGNVIGYRLCGAKFCYTYEHLKDKKSQNLKNIIGPIHMLHTYNRANNPICSNCYRNDRDNAPTFSEYCKLYKEYIVKLYTHNLPNIDYTDLEPIVESQCIFTQTNSNSLPLFEVAL
jgi:hypothetical protein